MSAEQTISWLQGLRDTEGYYVEEVKNDFAVLVDKALERLQINRAELAKRLGKSPAYVSKVLRGDANLTIASMVKISRAIGYKVEIDFRPKNKQRDWSVFKADARRPTARSVDSREASLSEEFENILLFDRSSKKPAEVVVGEINHAC